MIWLSLILAALFGAFTLAGLAVAFGRTSDWWPFALYAAAALALCLWLKPATP